MRLPPSRATFVIGALTAVAWAGVALTGATEMAAVLAGFIPERLAPGGDAMTSASYGIPIAQAVPVWLTPLSATLVHGGLLHLVFNLLMLGFCGRFVEVVLGARGLVALYLVGAYVAAAAQFAVDPGSLAPMIGASGAISALFGAYALLFGERRGRLADHRFGKALHVLWLAAAWIGFQLLVGFATTQAGAAIAVAAHIGGFIAGLVLAKPLLRWRYRHA
ncbi:rhomboid family intramembrane serine protease [Sphingomonas solaris]|uniref:Rhomboid family intramembrane serine protease n=1 Tax=Alterirhizorhabdus solaris TaxID=2529389 RepID=A0A558QWT5_9SPHN|nr:rhomboid family intramembrane serine protease [Sphingomonas solaris]TVV71559.1 rhomboid family intramembrane serine protease [Sphingomonas solaris]